MKWEYKNTTNMTEEDQKNFAKDPHKWMRDQLKEASQYDSLLARCYRAYVAIHEEEKNCDPFEQIGFFILLAYQALMSNAINFNQLIEAVNRNPNPPQLLIPKGSILLSDN